MCLLLLLIWSEDGEYSGQSLMFSVQTHTLLNHSEDNWQCFLAVVLAVCFALSIMILNVRKKNVVFFSRLIQSWGKIFFASDLVCNLGFLHWLQWIRLGKKQKNCLEFPEVAHFAHCRLSPGCVCVLGGLVTPGSPAAWLLKCWSGWTVGPIPWQPYATTLGYCQSYSYFAEQVPRVSIGISVAFKKKMAAWWLMGWDL